MSESKKRSENEQRHCPTRGSSSCTRGACFFVVLCILVLLSHIHKPFKVGPQKTARHPFLEIAQSYANGSTVETSPLKSVVKKTGNNRRELGLKPRKSVRLIWVERFKDYGSDGKPDAVLPKGTPKTLQYTRINKTSELFKLPAINFLPNFKNPCWYEDMGTVYEGNAFTRGRRRFKPLKVKWLEKMEVQTRPKRFRCLPYFFIAGQPKCGTTDLYKKLTSHPDIASLPLKEPHWWTRYRFGWQPKGKHSPRIPLRTYVNLFDKAALLIGSTINISTSRGEMITVDGSASTLWFNDYWQDLPENSNQSEPLIINAHYIQRLLPNAKVIVILRDPTERLYSDYLYFHNENVSYNTFHTEVKRAIDIYHHCLESHSVRSCVYNGTVAKSAQVRLRIGMYYVFLQEWLRIFPRNQIYVVRLEDYAEASLPTLKQIFEFLGLRTLSKSELKDVYGTTNIANTRRIEAEKIGDMLPDTRAILNDFYLPYNEELSKLMNDSRFAWTP